MKKTSYFIVVLLFLITFKNSYAQDDKNYYYKKFDANITVQKDSILNVEELQTYSYKGEFHKGYRNIPLDKVSDISNVEVIDGETGKPLQYSPDALDKLSPTSWNKYTYYKENGDMVIEWYYNLSDTDHLWILKYNVYGGLGFYKERDEVYWNIFTDYDVPIASSTVRVILPHNNFVSSDFTATAYTTDITNNPQKWYRNSDGVFEYFTAGPFLPKQSFTVALGWPKGLIDESSFWKYWFSKNWPHLASLFIFLGTLIFLFIYWLIKEKFKKGRGTIIAEYEPPHNLPPAMAELIVTEKSTPRAWSATIVDLAVRGYVKIIEEETLPLSKIIKIILYSISVIFFYIYAKILLAGLGMKFIGIFIVVVIFAILVSAFQKNGKNYKIVKLKNFASDEKLQDYEKEFLRILFHGRESFSTSKMKLSESSVKREMYRDMVDLKKDLLAELSIDESVSYDVPIKGKNIFDSQYILSIFAFILFSIIVSQSNNISAYAGLVVVVIWAIVTLIISIKYNPRLSKEGRIFKEEWLGFKLYLETAERYRMQNLTPEIFEKYLPYAIIFKIEKEWAKNFDSIITSEPVWYGHTVHGGHVGGVTNFSASSFSTSFSSSLSSAFASSGASGASGGGGSAGGGGGGGGGGAS